MTRENYRPLPRTPRGQYLANLIDRCRAEPNANATPIEIQMRIVELLCALLEEKIV